MRPGYVHLNIPRRGRFYFAFGVGLMFWLALRHGHGPTSALLGVGFFLASVVWLGCRTRPAGMEIRDGRWFFFVGARHWSVALRDIDQVQLGRDGGLAVRFRDGATRIVPSEIAPRIEPLCRELVRQGIPVDV